MSTLPVGAGVLHKATQRSGETVRIPFERQIRGYTAVRYDSAIDWQLVRTTDLRYVARRAETARAWKRNTP